ncbi:zinc ribbon domain-containing protein [Peptoniphilus olsenii]|uniref:zinc ribbon domain-containing protein n=1 Tax=Peptoniphilus olsenii TaxID=411570 RepID=UPI003397A0CF
MPLYCPNCGNKVSENDNFCASCGKNLRNVHIKIEKDDNYIPENKTKSSQETRVFKPISIDKIDTTDDIKNIIAEVDKRISKNIADYETGSAGLYSNEDENHFKEKSSDPISKPKTNSSVSHSDKNIKNKKLNNNYKNTEKSSKGNLDNFSDNSNNITKDNPSVTTYNKSKDNFNISQKELIKRVQEELKKSNYQDNIEDSDKKEATDYTDSNSSEKDKPKKFSLKEKWKSFINEDDDEFSIFSSINNEDEDSNKKKNIEVSKSTDIETKSFENTLETPKIDIKDLENYEAKKYSSDKIATRPNSKVKDNIKNNLDSMKSKKISKDKKDFKDSSFKLFDKFKNKNLSSDKKRLSQTVGSAEVLSDISNRENINKKSKNSGIFNLLLIATEKLGILDKKLSNYIKDIGTQESKIILAIGAALTAIQVIIGQFGFNFAIIISIILKLAFDYVEFYVPLNIAIDRDDMYVSTQELKKSALINWIICKVFLFVAFIISPFGGFFKYNLLSALTPMPLATVILIILSLLIALTQFRDEFENRSSINFVGWYALTFILFELLFKMIWFLINFIFVTLL